MIPIKKENITGHVNYPFSGSTSPTNDQELFQLPKESGFNETNQEINPLATVVEKIALHSMKKFSKSINEQELLTRFYAVLITPLRTKGT